MKAALLGIVAACLLAWACGPVVHPVVGPDLGQPCQTDGGADLATD